MMDAQVGFAAIIAVASVTMALVETAKLQVDVFSPPAIEGTATAPEKVAAGETVIVEWEIIKRTGCEGVTARVWHGPDGFFMAEPFQPTALPTSPLPKTYKIPTAIPILAPVGELTLEIVGEFNCPGADPDKFALGPVTMEVTR